MTATVTTPTTTPSTTSATDPATTPATDHPSTAATSSPTPLVGLELQHEIEQVLDAEADLMDSWKTTEWLALMAPDVHYWAPTQRNRTVRERGQELAAPMTAAYFDEDFSLLAQRVGRMDTSMAWAEEPRSRIRHLICNVRVRLTEVPDEYEVDSSFYLFRTRMEKEMDHFVGRRYDLLRRADTPYGFQIAKRTTVLDMSTLLAKNISVFF